MRLFSPILMCLGLALAPAQADETTVSQAKEMVRKLEEYQNYLNRHPENQSVSQVLQGNKKRNTFISIGAATGFTGIASSFTDWGLATKIAVDLGLPIAGATLGWVIYRLSDCWVAHCYREDVLTFQSLYLNLNPKEQIQLVEEFPHLNTLVGDFTL